MGKSLKFIREWGTERCVGYTFLLDEQKRVIAQHRLLFLPLHQMDIETDPKIEMRLSEGILKLRSDVFVWGVFLEGQETGNLTDNAFDLLPGIPYSLPWDEAICDSPKISRTGNSLLERK